MTNEQFMTCDYCRRILYYVPPPPKPQEAKAAAPPAETGAEAEAGTSSAKTAAR
jgi:hypothetical protein